MTDTLSNGMLGSGVFESADIFASVIFVIAMLVFWLGVFFVIYHLIRFGVGSQPKKIAFFFIGGSVLLSLITMVLFLTVISGM